MKYEISNALDRQKQPAQIQAPGSEPEDHGCSQSEGREEDRGAAIVSALPRDASPSGGRTGLDTVAALVIFDRQCVGFAVRNTGLDVQCIPEPFRIIAPIIDPRLTVTLEKIRRQTLMPSLLPEPESHRGPATNGS